MSMLMAIWSLAGRWWLCSAISSGRSSSGKLSMQKKPLSSSRLRAMVLPEPDKPLIKIIFMAVLFGFVHHALVAF